LEKKMLKCPGAYRVWFPAMRFYKPAKTAGGGGLRIGVDRMLAPFRETVKI
jgi:hypothetical protein